MRIHEGDEWKAAFTMHKGSFKRLVMYFGLCNLPAMFQRMMNKIFHDMSDVCMVYINDLMILMEKDNQEEHDRVMLRQEHRSPMGIWSTTRTHAMGPGYSVGVNSRVRVDVWVGSKNTQGYTLMRVARVYPQANTIYLNYSKLQVM